MRGGTEGRRRRKVEEEGGGRSEEIGKRRVEENEEMRRRGLIATYLLTPDPQLRWDTRQLGQVFLDCQDVLDEYYDDVQPWLYYNLDMLAHSAPYQQQSNR
ncbi:hypothetical protein PoB_002275900 [Plakobranchus ocellatus]|uniref:Uncharacterized protein n=1 Tax=Plakobranchus ocellatus TaxID=259542 RepID=A0AAV3ZLQ4_9GAST|nr:hypothetical protein PoB_002275900 [Plakobranchus ocellatus]